MRGRILCFLVLASFVVPSASWAQQVNTTDETSDWWDGAVQYNWYTGRTKGWGQVFEVPATSSFLSSFSFWMRQRTDMGHSLFRAHLATWDDATNSFTDVWVSPERDVRSPLTDNNDYAPLSDWGEQAFSPNIELTAGATYLAYLDISQVLSYVGRRSGDRVAWRWNPADGKTGLVEIRDGGFYDKWDDWDAAFTATFTPEPSAFLLLATGLLGIGGFGWVRRRRSS